MRTLFSKNKAASFRVDRLVRSFTQDLIFSTYRGKRKTQKHTELGLVLKRKTGSKQIVSLLNKFGHCISYDEVNMVETAVAEEQLYQKMYSSYVPDSVQPSVAPEDEQGLHTVLYLPAIDGSPTKMEVIQELLSQIKIKAEQPGLKSADAVFDHGIYAKALEVLTNPVNEELQSFINLRMGGFHACCIFISVIGKRFGAAGLKDIIVEADLTATGSVEATLKGKHYNRAMRILKTVFESLQRLKLEAFESWLLTIKIIQILDEFLDSNDFRNLIEKRNAANMANAEEKSNTLFSLSLWEEFTELIQKDSIGPMAVFWQSFLDMTETLLDYVKSFRTGHWEFQLQTMAGMLKWFHAYDNSNYARHFTYCWATQQKLAQKHPGIYLAFCKRNFSLRRSQGKFNKLPPDKVIEQTINKEQKGHGGIVG